jgi:iron transport multicopper oxidase
LLFFRRCRPRTDFTASPPTNSTPEAASYSSEYTVLLGDWYNTEHQPLVSHFISIANPGGAEPVPDSGLIYFAQNGSYLPPITGGKSGASDGFPNGGVGFNENATMKFEPGKTYRLRIINTSAFSMFLFWIEGHEMEIVEVDGVRSFLSVIGRR